MRPNAVLKILAYKCHTITENDTSQVITGSLTQRKEERILIKSSDGLERGDLCGKGGSIQIENVWKISNIEMIPSASKEKIQSVTKDTPLTDVT